MKSKKKRKQFFVVKAKGKSAKFAAVTRASASQVRKSMGKKYSVKRVSMSKGAKMIKKSANEGLLKLPPKMKGIGKYRKIAGKKSVVARLK